MPLRDAGAWLGEVAEAVGVLCAGGVLAGGRPAAVSGAGRLGPAEGDGVEDERPGPLDEGAPDGVAGLPAGAGPEPDGTTGGTGFADLAGETCRLAEVPAVGEATPGAAPPTGPDALAEFFGVARWTGMSGRDCAGVRSAGVAAAGRTAGAGAGEGAAGSVLLPVPRPVGALPARSPSGAGAGMAGRSWRETARCTGAPLGVLPPPVGLADGRVDGRAGALAAPETGAASATALVSGACPWRGRSGWGAGRAGGAGVGALVETAGRGGTPEEASALPAGARVALSVRAAGAGA